MKNLLLFFALILQTLALSAQIGISPIIVVDDIDKKEKPIQLTTVKVDVDVVGSLAVTTMEMTFRNPNARVMEGQLQFPLGEGQSVSRFALDINGKMRDGVPVEKARGQEVFESIVRRGVDPGLLEMTEGNNFRTRIYPLPAGGERRVIIAYEQTLKKGKDGLQVFLPVHFGHEAIDFTLHARVYGNERQPRVNKSPWGKFTFDKAGDVYTASYSKTKFKASGQLVFTIPSRTAKDIYVEKGKTGNETVFYAQLYPRVIQQPKEQSKHIAIYWDASLSMMNRNVELEKQLLDRYFKKAKNVEVDFVVFNCRSQKSATHTVSNGNWQSLSAAIDNVVYDGATRLDALSLNPSGLKEILLFSDGLSNLGKAISPQNANGVTTISSTLSANYDMLKYLSSRSGGKYINLMNTPVNKASDMLFAEEFRLISIDYNKSQIKDLSTSLSASDPQAGFAVSGKLTGEAALVSLSFGIGNKVLYTETIDVSTSQADDYSNIIPRVWAQMKIAELSLMYDDNKAAISRIGKNYGIVTRNTSLIVLERVEDYVHFDITPPDELLAEFNNRKERLFKSKQDINKRRINDVAFAFEKRKGWWNRTFPKGELILINCKLIDQDGNPILRTSLLCDDGFSRQTVYPDQDGKALIRSSLGDTITFHVPGYHSAGAKINSTEMTIRLDKEQPIQQQEKQQTIMPRIVTGKVVEAETGEPIIQASVTLVGRPGIGVATDLNGEFELRATDLDILHVSYIGYEAQQFAVAKIEGYLNVALRLDDREVEEFVMTGTGVQKMISTTAAISNADVVQVESRETILKERVADRAVRANPMTAGISLQRWEADAPYMKTLKETDKSQLYATYLSLREEYISSPFFYLDVATIFEEQGMKDEAFIILSNLIELENQNYRWIRVLAHRLLRLGYNDDAITLFARVLELRPEEPQSYRDLALAEGQSGNYQKAIDLLYEICTKNWDRRFDGVENIVLEEMNALIDQAKREGVKIETEAIDYRLIYNMPMDVRVVLNWDTDNSDMDLWVTDPYGEKCYYSNRLTRIGGSMSSDMRNGYGPEEFTIRDAVKGKYKIELNYYGTREQTLIGATTIYLDVFTRYATNKEEKETITLRLTQAEGRRIYIGEIEFK